MRQNHCRNKAQGGGNDLHQDGASPDDTHLLNTKEKHHAECRKPEGAAKHHRINTAEEAAHKFQHGGVSFRRGMGQLSWDLVGQANRCYVLPLKNFSKYYTIPAGF